MGEAEGAQQYCLRWNNHSDSIVSEFEELLCQEDFVDVTLSCDKQTIKAHKVVLSACSLYFRKLLKDNPCQHPIIILRDVNYKELAAILYFMYHGQVMVEQERIPQLLQTAQLLEVRGLCEIREQGDTSSPAAKTADGEPMVSASSNNKKGGQQSFLAGLLNTNVSATKRSASVVSDSCSNSSPTPPVAAKRQKSTSTTTPSRPVPMLQSILSQQLAVPNTPTFDLAMGSSTRALSALASRVHANKTFSPPTNTTAGTSNASAQLPTSLENMLGSSSTTGSKNNGAYCHSASSLSSEDERYERTGSSFGGDVDQNSSQGGRAGAEPPELEPDTVVEIKEEPLINYTDDDFGDEDNNRANTGDEDSDSEAETGGSENSRGEAFSLPLLAKHLAAPPNLLSASAKLRAAASQARSVSTGDGNPLIAQVIMGPSSPGDGGPSTVHSDASNSSFDPLGGDPPRKLAFHEPRPCPICRRMYRDAATLRTHTAIMHAEGRDPFACLCGELFRTKYEMYNHKKNGHR